MNLHSCSQAPPLSDSKPNLFHPSRSIPFQSNLQIAHTITHPLNRNNQIKNSTPLLTPTKLNSTQLKSTHPPIRLSAPYLPTYPLPCIHARPIYPSKSHNPIITCHSSHPTTCHVISVNPFPTSSPGGLLNKN